MVALKFRTGGSKCAGILNILDCLVIPNERYHNADADNSYVIELVSKFTQDAAETLKFLMDMDNQIPIYSGWLEQYIKFVDFLEIYNKVACANNHYYMWNENIEKNKEAFYDEHSKNMTEMLSRIYDHQKKLEKKINFSQKNLWEKICYCIQKLKEKFRC